uniref:Suppressor of fused homolog n=1 Tax=Eptatretus burgeri TaxID=7764 RepID=A0A8C4X190_EPTBU
MEAVGLVVPPVPPGLRAVYEACSQLYPDQPNPLQVTAIVKFWLGGPDPLDYISMYRNLGDPKLGIPEHWHYITFGLSDLHGDGRVHNRSTEDGLSGFGLELTCRLKREDGETAPPTWPAELLQGLARYVFQSESSLCAGDHVSWHAPLDGSESRIQHMLLASEPQLPSLNTPLGSLSFLQVVGVCTEELRAAQQWNGAGIIELIRLVPPAGGTWLVTDMRRGESIFELDPQLQDRLERGVASEGSNLSGVSARCAWESCEKLETEQGRTFVDVDDSSPKPRRLSSSDTMQIKDALTQGLAVSQKAVLPPIRKGSPPTRNPSADEQDLARRADIDRRRGSEDSEPLPQELAPTCYLEHLQLHFNVEAATLIPLALRGRLLHGRHFTFKSVSGPTAITLVSTGVEGALASESQPYATHGAWLQVMLTTDAVQQLLSDMEDIVTLDEAQLPKVYEWPEMKLGICVLPDSSFDVLQ